MVWCFEPGFCISSCFLTEPAVPCYDLSKDLRFGDNMSGFDLIIKPDEEDAEAAEVLVDGTIGGYKYRFLLDTGAARTRVIFDDYTSTFDCIEKSDSSGVFA